MGCVWSAPAVECMVWTGISDPDFTFPEDRLQEDYGLILDDTGEQLLSVWEGKDNIGVALSGDVKYLASSSGGSWIGSLLPYISDNKVNQFLGSYQPPSACDVKSMSELEDKSFAQAIALASIKASLAKNFFEDPVTLDHRDIWTSVVGDVFFKEFGLDNYDKMPLPDYLAGTPKKKALLSQLRLGVEISHVTRPFPIVCAAAAVGGHVKYAPLELTPLYHGIPSMVTIGDDPIIETKGLLGGCYVESHGFTSDVSSQQVKQFAKRVAKLLTPLMMNRRILHRNAIHSWSLPPTGDHSISSSAGLTSNVVNTIPGNKFPEAAYDLFFQDFNYCSPVGEGFAGQIRYTDGGGCDNSTILALLRRKVKKIICFFANNVDIKQERLDGSVAEGNTSASSAQIAALFGVSDLHDPENNYPYVSNEELIRVRHVFPKEGWDELVEGLRARVREGKPCIYLLNTKVLPNKAIAVPGNHDVSVLFAFNARWSGWIDNLPSDLQEELSKQHETDIVDGTLTDLGVKRATLENFPFTAVNRLYYSPLLVNCYAQYAAWSIMESQDLLKQLRS